LEWHLRNHLKDNVCYRDVFEDVDGGAGERKKIV
jgi:hypothetical protein